MGLFFVAVIIMTSCDNECTLGFWLEPKRCSDEPDNELLQVLVKHARRTVILVRHQEYLTATQSAPDLCFYITVDMMSSALVLLQTVLSRQ